MDDIFGRKIKYKDARTQWDGRRVYKGDYTEKQPQLDPQKYLKKVPCGQCNGTGINMNEYAKEACDVIANAI